MSQQEGVEVGDEADRVRVIGRPVRVRLQHALNGGVVARFGQQFQPDRRLTLPLGSVVQQTTFHNLLCATYMYTEKFRFSRNQETDCPDALVLYAYCVCLINVSA